MTRSLRFLFVTTALLLVLPRAVPAADDVTARLGDGEILVGQQAVEGSDVPFATLQAVVDAPPSRVWRVVSDCARYEKTMPRIAASKEVSRKGSFVTCQVTADLPFPLSDLTAVTRAEHTVVPGQRWTRKWELVEGDYEVNRGSWELVPFEGDPSRTLVRYRVQAKPRIAIPDSLARKFQTRALPDLARRLREAAVAAEDDKDQPGR